MTVTSRPKTDGVALYLPASGMSMQPSLIPSTGLSYSSLVSPVPLHVPHVASYFSHLPPVFRHLVTVPLPSQVLHGLVFLGGTFLLV